MALGQAIKKSRESRGITREQLAEQLDIVPRHLQSVENEGQYPSFQLFVRLITIFDISADQYIFPDKQTGKSTLRRQVDAILDTFEDKDLTVIAGTAKGICKASRTHKSRCCQWDSSVAYSYRRSCPPRYRQHRFRIFPRYLHGRFLRRPPNQRK